MLTYHLGSGQSVTAEICTGSACNMSRLRNDLRCVGWGCGR